jgi:hypothetical protein
MLNRVWHRSRAEADIAKALRHEPREPHAHKFSDLIKKSVGINQKYSCESELEMGEE